MRKYRHRNILPLFCSFVHGQHLWLVMPWVSGGTLAEIVQARCAPSAALAGSLSLSSKALQVLQIVPSESHASLMPICPGPPLPGPCGCHSYG